MTLLVAAKTLIEETAHINSGGNFTIDYLGSCSMTAKRWFSGEKKTNLFLISKNASKPLLMFFIRSLSHSITDWSHLTSRWPECPLPCTVNKLLTGQKRQNSQNHEIPSE